MFDTLITGGMVVDGTGENAAYPADIGIANGRITAIGNLSGERSHTTINADGRVITPGFVDIQNHSDSYGALLRTPTLESMCRQGITSILVGHAGSSLAPLLKGSLVSIQKWTDITGVNVDWRSMGEFLEVINIRRLGPNVATLIGHSTLRRDLIGDSPRALSDKEQDQLQTLLKRSMHEGGWGLSVGLEYTHERNADTSDIVSFLSQVAAQKGVASFHLRDEGEHFFESLKEIIELTEQSGVRAKISRIKIEHEADPLLAEQAIEVLTNARERGVDISIDAYPYTVSASTLYLLLPKWATEGGRTQLLEKLRNSNLREKIKEGIADYRYDYNNIRIASAVVDRTLMGKSIADLAKNQDESPEEVLLNLISASEDQMIVFFKNAHEELFEVFAKWPHTMLATNGVGYSTRSREEVRELPHPRSFGTTGRILGTYVRERKVLTLEEAVHKMSGLPASFLGLRQRGTIAKDNFADIVVLNHEEVADTATFENPFSSPRGIEHVFVNGTPVVRDGNYTGETPGIVLYK